jgi:hypothetical protein
MSINVPNGPSQNSQVSRTCRRRLQTSEWEISCSESVSQSKLVTFAKAGKRAVFAAAKLLQVFNKNQTNVWGKK